MGQYGGPFIEDEMKDIFDDLMDDAYGGVMIGGLVYPHSQVWERTDPTAYRMAFLEFWGSYEPCIRCGKYDNLEEMEETVCTECQEDGNEEISD